MGQTNLKEVTGETLKDLISIEVVTPQMYESVFQTKLKIQDSSLKLTEINNFIMDNLETINKIQKETQERVSEVNENIDLAQDAIEKHDFKALEEIKEQMRVIQSKIVELENEIYIDWLTKVYNRKWIFEKALSDGKFKEEGSLIFVDIDNFKEINERYGQVAGDKVLLFIANTLVKISQADLARFGGDKFIIFSQKSQKEKIKKELKVINDSFKTKSLKFKDETFKISLTCASCDYNEGDEFQKIAQIIEEKLFEKKAKTKEALEAS